MSAIEEYGVFAAVAEAYLSGAPVAVCGTAGAGKFFDAASLYTARAVNPKQAAMPCAAHPASLSLRPRTILCLGGPCDLVRVAARLRYLARGNEVLAFDQLSSQPSTPFRGTNWECPLG
jgi:hypothetical protein